MPGQRPEAPKTAVNQQCFTPPTLFIIPLIQRKGKFGGKPDSGSLSNQHGDQGYAKIIGGHEKREKVIMGMPKLEPAADCATEGRKHTRPTRTIVTASVKMTPFPEISICGQEDCTGRDPFRIAGEKQKVPPKALKAPSEAILFNQENVCGFARKPWR